MYIALGFGNNEINKLDLFLVIIITFTNTIGYGLISPPIVSFFFLQP